LLSLN